MNILKFNKVGLSLFALLLSVSIAIAAKHKPVRVADGSIELNKYQLESRIDLPEVEDDLSGLTFNPSTQSLFAVTNEPPQVVEISLDGKVKRLIKLIGFEDTEGITHIQGNRFALVEERKRQVVFLSIDSSTTQISLELCESYRLPLGGKANKGLEGIAWSVQHGFLIAKEDEPEQLYHFVRKPLITQKTDSRLGYSEKRRTLGNVAGLHSLDNGNTLFLSEASRTLLELSPDGQVLSKKSFGWLVNDPFRDFDYINQPEGITLSGDGSLFIVSEPNQLLIFKKPKS